MRQRTGSGKTGMRTRSVGLAAGAFALLLLAGACSDSIQVRGNLPDEETLAQLAPGAQSRADVARLLGSPSAVSVFRDKTWFYVGMRTRRFAFLRPDILERRVVEVAFDERGMVRDTRLYDLADGEEIDPVDRVTPTAGREVTILQQLFGNLGRFQPPQQ
jgi:outer membrane protein assembly factor BamE (lipoprotein component of BamABCDE complex)